VLKIPADEVEAPPAVFQEGGLNCVTGLGKYKGRLIVLLDMNKLLQKTPRKRDDKDGNGKAEINARGAAAK
jgi:chemotaxis signal transduction protein